MRVTFLLKETTGALDGVQIQDLQFIPHCLTKLLTVAFKSNNTYVRSSIFSGAFIYLDFSD